MQAARTATRRRLCVSRRQAGQAAFQHGVFDAVAPHGPRRSDGARLPRHVQDLGERAHVVSKRNRRGGACARRSAARSSKPTGAATCSRSGAGSCSNGRRSAPLRQSASPKATSRRYAEPAAMPHINLNAWGEARGAWSHYLLTRRLTSPLYMVYRAGRCLAGGAPTSNNPTVALDGMGHPLPTSRAPRDSDEHLTAVFDRLLWVFTCKARTPQAPQSKPPRKRMNFDNGDNPQISGRPAAGSGLLSVTVQRACELSGLGRTCIWAFLKNGRLEAVRVPGVRRTLVSYASLAACSRRPPNRLRPPAVAADRAKRR